MNALEDLGPAYLANHYLKRGLQTLSVLLEETRWRKKVRAEAPLSEEAIRRLLQERFPRIRPKPRGKLSIFFVGIGDPTGYNEGNLYPSLRTFGALTLIQPGAYPGHSSTPQQKNTRTAMGQKLLSLAEDLSSQPDVLLGQMAGWLLDPNVLLPLKKRGIPILNYSWDDTATFYGRKMKGVWSGPAAFASIVDLNLTSSRRSCLKYQAEGGLALFWPEAANPEIHRPYNVPFEYDVSFVGGHYGYRPLLIEFLRRHGVNVATFGLGWERGALPLEEMIALYSKSRINLGFGGKDHMVSIQHLKGRDFEIPMSGGLYLTSRHPDLAECYEIGKEVVCYRDKWDCLGKIRHLLKHSEEAAAIRKAGRERALRDHTWEQRFERLFHLVGLL